MGMHDKYGKRTLKGAAGPAYAASTPSVRADYGLGRYANVDGTVGSQIAVEIESRVSKQVRGAVVDLVLHSYPKKLLILLPVHMNNPERTVAQCEHILARFLDKSDLRVVLLQGHGSDHKNEIDIRIVRRARDQLGSAECS
jgi:hypothetical protein